MTNIQNNFFMICYICKFNIKNTFLFKCMEKFISTTLNYSIKYKIYFNNLWFNKLIFANNTTFVLYTIYLLKKYFLRVNPSQLKYNETKKTELVFIYLIVVW